MDKTIKFLKLQLSKLFETNDYRSGYEACMKDVEFCFEQLEIQKNFDKTK